MTAEETLDTLQSRLEAHKGSITDAITGLNPDMKGVANTLANLQGQLQIVNGYIEWLKRERNRS